jgi:hypothetical protein
MSSILNSISAGELQVQQVPEVKPVKEDSIIDLLQNSEIEFDSLTPKPNIQKPIFEESFELPIPEESPKTDDSIEDLLENSEIELDTCPDVIDKLESVNTGFGENNDLHYEDSCKPPELKRPLYKENYLREFSTEEEKAAARHALGLYNKGDVVAMSLLTAEDVLPNTQDWINATLKQMRKGDEFFTPITSFNAVFDSLGVSLNSRMNDISDLLITHQKEIVQIITPTQGSRISSLGDVGLFLQGFNNGDNLHAIIDQMDQDMLRFEKTGDII